MTIIVCGGRDYYDRNAVFTALDNLDAKKGVRRIINGGATGADELSSEWAKRHGISLTVIKADWTTHGRAAGPIRNQAMLDRWSPGGVVAFPGGDGTADMIRRAEKAGVKVWHPVKRN